MRAAAVQLNSTEDVAGNIATADRLVREAAGRGARLVLLPEKWNVLGRGEVMAQAAEPVGPGPGPSLRWAGEIARELHLDLVAGSVVEHRPDRDRSANTSVHFGPDGGVRAVYRKLHMFDVEVDGVRYAESEHEEPGREVVVSELADGTPLGLTICYDVRFPELYRELSQRQARVLTVPSAFTLATTRDHWEVLLRARAIENQCFVVAANQIGENAPGRRSGGRSMIVDPWGVVLATAPDAEGVIVADLDFSRLEDIRRRLPVLEHRRPHDVYADDRVRA
ncbi:MAG TPA: carbon-nitrogen hydrolase family protein [Solirubrobacteraceae bacterium]|nr:carbon-nitrogen hydrolase family protein [Solirubrobacteraceae bacterium]